MIRRKKMIAFHYGVYGLRGNNGGVGTKNSFHFYYSKEEKIHIIFFSLIMFEQIAILWREHQKFPHFCY
jgi:nitrate/nitrite transporter NarK